MLNAFLIVVVAFAMIWQGVSMLLAWENRRYSLVRLGKQPKHRRIEPRVALFLPCKGDDGDLRENLVAFFLQLHPNFELNLIVESELDAACSVIQSVQKEYPNVDSRLIVAGVASRDGQKVHNLRIATENLSDDVRILAFADADIRPDDRWLQALTLKVCKSKNTIANTGYRWMLPERNTLTNLVVYSINATIAGTMGAGKHFLIWGGSWAIRRSNFERLAIRDAWQGTLSDDLVASGVIHKDEGNVRYAPKCLCSTAFDMSANQALEFLRRQYLIGRKYSPRLFWPGYIVLLTTVSAWWIAIGIAMAGSGSISLLAAIAGLTIYLLGICKALMRQSVFRKKNPRQHARHRLAVVFDVIASPLVSSVNLVVMTWSLFGSRICWRENHYHIHRDGQIEKLAAANAIQGETNGLEEDTQTCRDNQVVLKYDAAKSNSRAQSKNESKKRAA